LKGVSYKVCVLDNSSSDETVSIARRLGAKVIIYKCPQDEALNILLHQSKARYTLFLHSDVILLNTDWYNLLSKKIINNVVLVSPEDIGLGNYLRTYGKGMPESSFMFFETKSLKALCNFSKDYLKKYLKQPAYYPIKHFNFYVAHITHKIPEILKNRSLSWIPMRVLPSRKLIDPWFQCSIPDANWGSDWGYYEYGFGNFYSLDGVVTHYHNWYSRQLHDDRSVLNPNGVPLAYIHEYSLRFLTDYQNASVHLPDISPDA
jgi:glycosyltransferase involved in cell wall biosynthesis